MNILITGASKGIGYKLVQEFLKDKNNKVVALSRNSAGLKKLQAEAPNPENLRVLAFDITDYKTADLHDALEQLPHIDILINNAGALLNKPFEETSLAEWKAIFDVNLFGPVKLIADILPKLKKAKAPHIVNIGSMGGIQGSLKFKGLSAYSASKAALANLTECLAEELQEHAISVNCLCLGAVNTEMLRQAFPDYAAPLESVDMAGFIHHFAINNHKFINGKILPISASTP
jgi:NAD(P)-dependent dehydrogenase (short-subunit alcohol dehydrogenase family)